MNTILPKDVRELNEALVSMPELKNYDYNNSMRSYKASAERLNALHGVDRYDVVFIGEPGMGKTSTICTWLGLVKSYVSEVKTVENSMLLSVNQGRTTVAEVRIRQTEGRSRMLIEYCSKEVQTSLIRDYCKYYYERFFPVQDEEDEEDDSEPEAHSEVDRVIRHMARINDIPKEGTEKYDNMLSDLKKLGSFDAFFNCVMKRIKLEDRDLAEIVIDEGRSFEDWLSTTFKDVNNGKNPRCGIPDKIMIEVGREDFDLRLPDYVRDVVDTKGLDTSARLDLQRFMDSDDTVCVIMDRLNNVPSNANRTLLKTAYLGEEYAYYAMKTLMFVRASDEELAAVNEAEGDPDVGKQKKLGEMDRKIQAEKLVLFSRNTAFMDSRSPFEIKPVFEKDGDGKLKRKLVLTGYSKEMAEVFRQEVEDCISSAIGFLRSNLEAKAEEIKEGVEALVQLDEDFKSNCVIEELDLIRTGVENAVSIRIGCVNPIPLVDAVVDRAVFDVHWRSLRKMNSLYGAYGGYGGRTDTYTQVHQAGREAFYREAKALSDDIRKVISMHSSDEDVKAVTDPYLMELGRIVEEETINAGNRFEEWALCQGFYPQSDDNLFWTDVNALRGRGYKDRVGDRYRIEIREYGDVLVEIVTDGLRNIAERITRSMSR